MAHAVIGMGDTHTFSVVGLTPPTARSIEGATIGLTPVQEYEWECWEYARTIYLPSVCGKAPRILFHLGDAMEGIHRDQSGLDANEEVTQAEAAAQLVKPLAETCEAVFMCAGTHAHAGKMAQYDNLVGKELGAQQSTTGRYAQWSIYQNIDGVLFHAAHHIGGSYVDASDMTPLVGEWGGP